MSFDRLQSEMSPEINKFSGQVAPPPLPPIIPSVVRRCDVMSECSFSRQKGKVERIVNLSRLSAPSGFFSKRVTPAIRAERLWMPATKRLLYRNLYTLFSSSFSKAIY